MWYYAPLTMTDDHHGKTTTGPAVTVTVRTTVYCAIAQIAVNRDNVSTQYNVVESTGFPDVASAFLLHSVIWLSCVVNVICSCVDIFAPYVSVCRQ